MSGVKAKVHGARLKGNGGLFTGCGDVRDKVESLFGVCKTSGTCIRVQFKQGVKINM